MTPGSENAISILDGEFYCLVSNWLDFIKKNIPGINAETIVYKVITQVMLSGDKNKKMSKTSWTRVLIQQLLDFVEDSK